MTWTMEDIPMMRVLLPLHMYSVTYELAHGRPYSKLEELLLRAVNDFQGPTGCTYRDLREVFKVHDRLLTEGLVTLIQEGWVAMVQEGREMHYLVTEEGRLTIAHKRRPSNLRVRTARANIVRERLTGQLARSADLALITGPTVRRAMNHPVLKHTLTPRMHRTKINGGETERLLPRSGSRQEWIRWIDSIARLNTDLYYLPVLADLEKSEVAGLPHQWRHLGSLILEEVAERYEDLASDGDFQEKLSDLMRGSDFVNGQRGSRNSAAPRRTTPYAEASVTCGDVTLTAGDGRQLAESVLDGTSTNVLILAAGLDRERASTARDLVIALRKRGVNVDLLWSCDTANATENSSANEIAEVLGAARSAAGSGKVSFNRTPAHAAADLVLATTPTGPVAVIGAGLLGAPADEGILSPAARFSDPAVLGTLARLCAGWWEELPADEGSLPAHRWKHLAERWVGEAAVAGSVDSDTVPARSTSCPDTECTGTVSLLIGPQQAGVRSELTAEQGQRFLLADMGSTTDNLATQITENLAESVGQLYRVVGAADGWQFLSRTADIWTATNAPQLPQPSERYRVTATDDQWLIEYIGAPDPVLSFSVSGHVAMRAWRRMGQRHDSTGGV
ncbi:hypothetical protein ACIP39_30430 [Streptomyces tibetensis]|uniref:hypothetical protein n=1 Tax=Streptomyces tibetensis TaxID=2382123 RepID=UPI00381D0A5B